VSAELREYQEQIVLAVQDGYDGTDYVNQTHKWPFSGAFLYSLTVITTIGEWHDALLVVCNHGVLTVHPAKCSD
jgi:hypothetical protein